MKNLSSKFFRSWAVVLALLGLAGPVLVANLFLLYPAKVLADTVSPPTFSANLPQGKSVTINKTVIINAGGPTSAKIDVLFLADTTGSMSGAITNVQNGASAIMSSSSALGDVAFAVAEYRDVGDAYVYRLNQDFTKDSATVQTGINAWYADGGGDYEEAELYGLYEAATTSSWRPGSTRILIWFGDAPGHDPAGPDPGVTEAEATAALVAQTIKVLALDVGALNYSGQAQRIADATSGAYYTGVDVSQIVTVIQNAITTSFSTYDTVSLGTASVPTGISVNVSPPSYTGTYDRSIDRTFNFSVTFTAVAPGSFSFAIPVLVDGGAMASEEDNIQVAWGMTFPIRGYSSTTAPVSAVMDNSVLERTPILFYQSSDVIKAFDGETGAKQYGGVKYMDSYGSYWAAYKNSGGTDFFPPDSSTGKRPLNYLNGPWLSYAGNPGYNYQVAEGTPVLATADGKLYKVVNESDDPVNDGSYADYQNSYIDHQNGFYSWYLYAPLNPDILSQISANGFAQVRRGQSIGTTVGDHLHFEVRRNGKDDPNVVDPYKLGLWQSNTSVAGPLMLLQEESLLSGINLR